MTENRDFRSLCDECKDIKGNCIILTTDEYVIDYWDPDTQSKYAGDIESKLIEVRIFNETCEYKLFRTHIGEQYAFRKVVEQDEAEGGKYSDYYDQKQFLDIDSNRSKKESSKIQSVYPTGSNRAYTLPITDFNEDAAVTIRYYIDRYEESGQARVFDWRVVKIDGGVTNGN